MRKGAGPAQIRGGSRSFAPAAVPAALSCGGPLTTAARLDAALLAVGVATGVRILLPGVGLPTTKQHRRKR